MLWTDVKNQLIRNDACSVCGRDDLKSHGHRPDCLGARVEAAAARSEALPKGAHVFVLEPAAAFHLRRAVQAEFERLRALAAELSDMGHGNAAAEVGEVMRGLSKAKASITPIRPFSDFPMEEV